MAVTQGQAGTGGAGQAVTLAPSSVSAGAYVAGSLVDGAITTLGTLADAAVGDAAGSLNAHARQIAKLLGAGISLGAGAAVIGAVTQSGGWTVSGTGTFTTAGGKTNNNAAPGATNVGSLGAVATAAVPTYTEGNLVALSTDLSGNQRVTGTVTANAGTGPFAIQATAAAPASVQLSDGSAFYVGAKTGQLPTALVSSRLDVNLGAAPATVTVKGGVAPGSAATDNPVLVAGQNGGNIKLLALDASGNPTVNQGTVNGSGTNSWAVQGAAGAGAALAGNPVLVGASDTVNVQNLQVQSSSSVNLRTAIYDSGNRLGLLANNTADGISSVNGSMQATGLAYLNNGSNWDRQRSSQDVSLHGSAATGTGTVNTDITTYNYKFLVIHANVTNYNAGNVLFKVQMQDANGIFVDIPLATTGAVTTGADIFLTVGPTAWPANASPVFYANQMLPRTIRIVQTVASATVTFSAAYCLKN